MTDAESVSSWVVPDSLDGERLDRALALLMGVSRSEVATAIAAGEVQVDRHPALTRSVRLRGGQVVAVQQMEPTATAPLQPAVGPAPVVVLIDDDVIVVDKAAGVVVHPGAGSQGPTLVESLLAIAPAMAEVGPLERPGVVHRLDVGTSGLLMFARSERAFTDLIEQLSARTVRREYITAVRGHMENPRGVIDAPIARSVRQRTKMAVVASGRPARTHFVVTASADGASGGVDGLRCRLETGRTHQIRVHLSAVGHPVVGDLPYGGGRLPDRGERPFLHAAVLGFRHPGSGEYVEFQSALPADLRQAWSNLGGTDAGIAAMESTRLDLAD